MKMTPDILVIMPCYNTVRTIDEALLSVYNQSYMNFSLVCIDDCSIDNTYQRLTQLKSKYKFTLLQTPCNQGTGSAINFGINSINNLDDYKYITWISSDNILQPYFFETLRNTLINSHADICYGSWQILYADTFFMTESQKRRNIRKISCEPNTNILSLKTLFALGPAFMYTVDLWKKVGPYHSLPGEDYLFAVEAALNNANFTFHTGRSLMYYRAHENSVSGRLQKGMLKETITDYAKERAQLL